MPGRRADNIFDVVAEGTPDELRALIVAGGRVDAVLNGEKTPLLTAVFYARVDQARVLLEHGAPPDVSSTLGGSPLFECAGDARPPLLEIAALLLEHGADPNHASRFDGGPLHAAARHNNLGAIELLLAKGASIDAPDQHGWTPLHVAAHRGRLEAVATLLRLGADPSRVTPEGKTAALLTSSARIRKLLPLDPTTEAAMRKVDSIFATFRQLGWFKYVPPKDVDRIVAKYRDAYLAQPTLVAPFKKDDLRSIDGRSCAADAEEVAEGGAHEVVLMLADSLGHEGVTFSSVESIAGDGGYDLVIDGERHPLSSATANDWEGSLDRLVAIVNLLLSRAGSSERLYTVGAGNDAAVVLLSPELLEFAKTLDIRPPLTAFATAQDLWR